MLGTSFDGSGRSENDGPRTGFQGLLALGLKPEIPTPQKVREGLRPRLDSVKWV